MLMLAISPELPSSIKENRKESGIKKYEPPSAIATDKIATEYGAELFSNFAKHKNKQNRVK